MKNDPKLSEFLKSLFSKIHVPAESEKIISRHMLQKNDYLFWIIYRSYRYFIPAIENGVLLFVLVVSLVVGIRGHYDPSVIAILILLVVVLPFLMFRKTIMLQEIFSERDMIEKISKKCTGDFISKLTESDFESIRKFSQKSLEKRIFILHKLLGASLPSVIEKASPKWQWAFNFMQKLRYVSCGGAIILFIAFFFVPGAGNGNLAMQVFINGIWLIGFWLFFTGITVFSTEYIRFFPFQSASTGLFPKVFGIMYVLMGLGMIIIFSPWVMERYY